MKSAKFKFPAVRPSVRGRSVSRFPLGLSRPKSLRRKPLSLDPGARPHNRPSPPPFPEPVIGSKFTFRNLTCMEEPVVLMPHPAFPTFRPPVAAPLKGRAVREIIFGSSSDSERNRSSGCPRPLVDESAVCCVSGSHGREARSQDTAEEGPADQGPPPLKAPVRVQG